MISLIYNDKIINHTKWFIFNVTVENFIIHCLILLIYETVYALVLLLLVLRLSHLKLTSLSHLILHMKLQTTIND